VDDEEAPTQIRVWETIQVKKSLFAAVFDSPTDEISFASLGKKSVLQAVKEVFADQPGRPKPVAEVPPPVPVPIAARVEPAPPAVTAPAGDSALALPGAPTVLPSPDGEPLAQAAAGFLEAGIRFLETLATPSGAGSDGASGSPVQRWLAGAIQTDPRTNRPVLALPLPESITEERLAGALTSLMAAFGARR
jgi:hypothetical protein